MAEAPSIPAAEGALRAVVDMNSPTNSPPWG